jgi:hypothetical protein
MSEKTPKALYHCTDDPDPILYEGYESDIEMFMSADLSYRFHEHLSPEDRRLISNSAKEDDADTHEKLSSRIAWKRFGMGTVIWLGVVPETYYGDYCFQVKPPRGALLSVETGNVTGRDYWLMWSPLKPIPPKYFRLLEPEEIDEVRGGLEESVE